MKKQVVKDTKNKKYVIMGVIGLFIICLALKGYSLTEVEKGQETSTLEVKNNLSAEVDQENETSYLLTYDDLVDCEITSEEIKDIEDSPYRYNADQVDNILTSTGSENIGVSDDESSDEDSIVGNSTEVEDKSKQDQSISNSENDDVKVIDESSKTIKDETIKNEYEGESSPSKEIQFFDVEPSGNDYNGDIDAGGKQDVGTWD